MKLLALCFFLACASAQYWPGYTQPGYSGWYNPYLYPAVAPAPFYGKTTLNTVVAEANPFAPTPADTVKLDYKQKSFDVVTPYVYPAPYYPTTYPYYSPVVAAAPSSAPSAAPSADPATGTPLKVESSRKKRQVYPGSYYPYPYPSIVPAPFYGKTTLKTVVAEANPFAPTPADTTKLDYKQKSFEVVSPYVYPTPSVYPVPSVYPTPYVYPTSYNPYTYPIYQNPAANPAAPSPAPAGAPLKVESSRKKRQVVAVLPNKQFIDDLKYKSVDLNQDGQPDVPVYPALPTIKYVQPTVYPTWPSWSTLSTPYTYGYLG